jgi:hypothetical protein
MAAVGLADLLAAAVADLLAAAVADLLAAAVADLLAAVLAARAALADRPAQDRQPIKYAKEPGVQPGFSLACLPHRSVVMCGDRACRLFLFREPIREEWMAIRTQRRAEATWHAVNGCVRCATICSRHRQRRDPLIRIKDVWFPPWQTWSVSSARVATRTA